MENLDFTFKKNRKLGELISDYITLYKHIFKHFNKNILTLSLPFVAIIILAVFAFITQVIPTLNNWYSGVDNQFIWGTVLAILIAFIFMMILGVTTSTFGIEYMFLLEEKRNTDFTISDILNNVKARIGKYITFFFYSILIMLLLSIPIGIISFILAVIPILGMIATGIFSAMVMLFFYCALFLYIQDRETLGGSYMASFNLIKSKIFEYGVATYLFQFMTQITLGFIAIIPVLILFMIGLFTYGFSADFFQTFGGKFLIATGSALLLLLTIFAGIYMITFAVLQYFSLLEVKYGEETLDDIEQIGNTTDEF